MNIGFLGPAVATVLTVYGIETNQLRKEYAENGVATVLTVYGIETVLTVREQLTHHRSCNSTYRLRY